ncbi:hypothetical protein METBIDRAFT_39754 [Metschnikowia bicuspidata var. bicuspidata NRRL YB-4993]|uniref:Reticulon-like protein n=1 Tax=Metschnikowia bicuspidata var. bicuspidata NRRL YB-4993 TaxID=869754 RepID=A0A1A0HER6_9ASCO|nr:hypothetical protein METBIDRAFT_39754 [Metschnikowia bicuspidata var. bicuspidata NRRL YB-4993]OBA22382.1 hypothetical protein METBIDRAFT_39754 [Metschnikowia bicuspidata var. bicuspidata NRRL YB-4993]
MSSSSSLPAVPSQSCVCSLLTWKDPVATGKVFGAIVAALVLAKVNVVNHVFHLLYLALFAAAGSEYAGRILTGQGFVQKYIGTPQKRAGAFKESVLPAVGNAAEALEAEFHRVVYAQNIESTVKAALVSYMMYKLTSWFSVYALVFATVLLAFSVPYVYQTNKKNVDAAVAQYTKMAKERTAEYTACAKSRIAPRLEALAKKTGPVGAFVQSKLPTRTAGSTVGSHAYSAADEPSVGVSTGAAKFPEVPAGVSHSSPQSVTEAVEATPELSS